MKIYVLLIFMMIISGSYLFDAIISITLVASLLEMMFCTSHLIIPIYEIITEI